MLFIVEKIFSLACKKSVLQVCFKVSKFYFISLKFHVNHPFFSGS